MRELFITDMKRILKDKVMLAVVICLGAFAIVTPLMNFALVEMMEMEEMEMIAFSLNARALFFDAFSPTNNFGMVLPILLAIIVCRDFKYGTVRNKLISGKTRSQTFFAMFFATSVVICGAMAVYGLLTLGVSLLFFPYQPGRFDFGDFGYLLLSLLFEMLLYLLISSIIIFFVALVKKSGLSIVLYFAVNLGLSMVGSIFLISMQISEATGAESNAVFEFFNNINIFTSGLIGKGTSYSLTDVAYIVLPTLLLTGLFVFFGNFVFKRSDLK